MLTQYIKAAMNRARYEILSDGTFRGEIAGLNGVYANAGALAACRVELENALENWILLCISRHDPLPILDGIELPFGEVTCYLNLVDTENA